MIRTISAWLYLRPSGSAPLLMHVCAIDRYTHTHRQYFHINNNNIMERHQKKKKYRTPDVFIYFLMKQTNKKKTESEHFRCSFADTNNHRFHLYLLDMFFFFYLEKRTHQHREYGER
jgi:hypothetical protein